MSQDLTDLQLLHELEPVVEQKINRHMAMRKDWNPHDYIPWQEGKNWYALGGQDWEPGQSKLSEVAQTANFALQVALTRLWKSWGVEPAAVVGHSVGEIASSSNGVMAALPPMGSPASVRL